MLTGERPFRAENPTSLAGAILEREPEPLRERLPLTPPSLERLARRCLAKDPDDRWDTAHDVADELRCLLFAGGATAAALVMKPWATPKRPGWRGVTTVSLHLPPDEPLAATAAPPSFAVSPDGRSVAYVAAGESGEHIRIQPLDGNDGTTLPETEGARGVFFSHDGHWLCFFTGSRLRKISLAERHVTTLGDVGGAYGWAAGHWGDDGTIVYASLAGIHAIPAEGGKPPRLIIPSESDRFHTQPHLLPGGRQVVFTTGPAGLGVAESIAIQPVAGGAARVLISDGAQATYMTSGHLVYVRAGALTAVPFDAGRGALTGAPFELPHEVGHTFRSLFAVSDAGTLAYLRPRNNRTLTWVDRSGISSSVLGPQAAYQYPRLSPDGETVAVQAATGVVPRIWVVDPRRQTRTLLTSEGDGRLPLWTPDGQRVTFSSGRQGGRRVFWQPADAGEAPELIDAAEDPIHDTDGSWHPDGLVLAHTGYDGDWHILLPRPGSGEAPRRFFQGSTTDFEPRFSPDGRWLAYSSNQRGVWEVYVRSYPDGGGRQQVSVGGGHDPVWARNGREIFYRGDGGLHVVPVTSGSGLAFGQPQLLFEGSYLDTLGAGNYDVSPDGKRFLMVAVPEEERRPTRLEIALNWFEELEASTGD